MLRRLLAPREERERTASLYRHSPKEEEVAQGEENRPEKKRRCGRNASERPSANNLEGLVDGDGELVGVACQAERVACDEANGRVMLKEGYL